MFSADDFCTLLMQGACATSAPTGFTIPYADMAACVTAYTAVSTAGKMCRSYHLCNAVGTNDGRQPHDPLPAHARHGAVHDL